ncbi:MAG TPA: TonB-dependent receptor [Thermoanaerobaculia bacterium]|nr:TonB-dependent receptor [Thermoanaerobaculia bacterium]
MIALLLMLYAGHPLVEALRDLESKGLRLVYSEDVVTRDMVVKSEPRATEPRRVLDELLREHGLTTENGPRGTLLIVKAKAQPQAPEPLMPKTLAQIVVTPSRFELLGEEPEQRQFLSREDVRRVPHISDDFYRAIRRIPGAASDDLTARFNIRGGEEDEAVILLDGAEIYDPFHVKDLIRAFSSIDAEAIGSVDILTGGFPAEYGGRMSGVIDIASLAPSETKTQIGVSLLNLNALSQGTMADGRGQWLLSIRRGYLHELLELVDSTNDVDPRYYDLIGKLQWTLSEKHVLSAHVFASRDILRLEESSTDDIKATYYDTYAWLNLRSTPRDGLLLQNVVQYGSSGRNRHGAYLDVVQFGRVDDRRDFDFAGVKNDTSFDVSARNLIKGGFTVKRAKARYDYDGEAVIEGSLLAAGSAPRVISNHAHLGVTSTDVAVYASDRFKVADRVILETGARWETESHTPDGGHFSPRVNGAWMLAPSTTLRAAWGWFYQPQGVYELQVDDGVNQFFPAQRAEHRVIGIDHHLGRTLTARIEAYDKVFTHPRPRFENLFDRIIAFQELRDDRVRVAPERSTARGVEVLLRHDSPGPFSGWINFTHATVTDEIDGRKVPRAWDQRNAVTFSANYTVAEHWNFNVAATWHSGWPSTPIVVVAQGNQLRAALGPLRSERLPAYKRVDFRVSRRVGTFTLFVDVFNALNQANASTVNGFLVEVQSDGTFTTKRIDDPVVGVVPSFGVSWQF